MPLTVCAPAAQNGRYSTALPSNRIRGQLGDEIRPRLRLSYRTRVARTRLQHDFERRRQSEYQDLAGCQIISFAIFCPAKQTALVEGGVTDSEITGGRA